MGYMGDRVMPYPAMLAQDMLKKGSENLDLRDEIYLQIIKQMKVLYFCHNSDILSYI